MAAAYTYWQDPILPWSETDNDQRFAKILRFVLILSIIVGLTIPFLPVPEKEKKKLEQVSPRLAKLIIEKKKKVAAPKPKKAIAKKKVQRKKMDKVAAARKKAQSSGLLAMSKELSSLRETFDMSAISSAVPLSKSSKERTNSKTSSLAKSATRGSGGINTRKLSRATGNEQLANREASNVKSSIGGSGGSGRSRTGGSASRGEEEIELVFQKNKGAIFSIYNRALRKDPTLQGKVVLELTIAANGQVTKVRIVSSELKNKALEQKLIARIKLFRFAPKQVSSVTVTYPIDFLPS